MTIKGGLVAKSQKRRKRNKKRRIGNPNIKKANMKKMLQRCLEKTLLRRIKQSRKKRNKKLPNYASKKEKKPRKSKSLNKINLMQPQ